MNFERRGFIVKGIFDINPALQGKELRGIPVRPVEQIADFVKANDIDIAVLTIPKDGAVKAAETLGKCRDCGFDTAKSKSGRDGRDSRGQRCKSNLEFCTCRSECSRQHCSRECAFVR